MSDLSLLIDMGFPQEKAKKALDITGNKGIEPAMEWLLAHGDSEELVPEKKVEEAAPDASPGASEEKESEDITELTEELMTEAKSLKCDECNRKFRTDSEVEFHAVKTGHQSFSESSEEVKPLTEEERREQIKKVENLIKLRRAEKAEQEKKEELEKEKNRRKTGQEMIQAREKLKDEEFKRLAELKRQEKLEAKMARQRVLDDIERDRQARREKFGMGPPAATAPAATSPPASVTSTPPQSYDECKLQIRLTNGQCMTHTFNPKEELAAVRLFIEMNRTDGAVPFNLMTNFPKRIFTESDMNAPLHSLGLVPSAVLILSKQQQ
ncbi:UBX domain-containing protein 1-like [Uloborus diversus]|uniref:UBX domain-containing protein 1-like n=1 Tax=Uloborus diversus TaxID=327109 RepID=UPI00240A673B|nr:UBX domain-containing protein 1-like [Uloborus diversus]